MIKNDDYENIDVVGTDADDSNHATVDAEKNYSNRNNSADYNLHKLDKIEYSQHQRQKQRSFVPTALLKARNSNHLYLF